MRIVALYFFVWTPFLIVAFVNNFAKIGNSYLSFTISSITHLQAFFTTNDLLRAAMKNLMRCRWRQDNLEVEMRRQDLDAGGRTAAPSLSSSLRRMTRIRSMRSNENEQIAVDDTMSILGLALPETRKLEEAAGEDVDL